VYKFSKLQKTGRCGSYFCSQPLFPLDDNSTIRYARDQRKTIYNEPAEKIVSGCWRHDRGIGEYQLYSLQVVAGKKFWAVFRHVAIFDWKIV
jgi:hypothetical protein